MSQLFGLLVSGSPVKILTAFVVLVGLVLFAPVIKLEAHAWFLRRRGVSKKQLRDWALAEVKKGRRNPLVEIIHAMRRGRDDGAT